MLYVQFKRKESYAADWQSIALGEERVCRIVTAGDHRQEWVGLTTIMISDM